MKKILVVPDVHGREFWKVVKGVEGEVVFLGDYHDPYPYEFDEGVDYISQSIENFNEIIEFARANGNVTLLLGNHDFHYLYTSHYSASVRPYSAGADWGHCERRDLGLH